MELKIERDVLTNLLSKVHPIIPGKSTMPALSNVLVEAREERVYITATDLETSVTAIGGAIISREGEISLNGKNLYNLVKELPSVTLEFRVDNLISTIQYEKGRFTMTGIPKDEFPKLLTVGGERKIHIPYEVLQRAIDKTLFAASTGDIGGVLSGGLIDLSQEEARVVATDGHRLGLFKIATKLGKIAHLLIPSNVLKELAWFSSGIDIVFDENRVGFYSEDMIVVSRLMEGEYPPYETAIPKDNDKLLVVSKDEFISALRRVVVFAPEISRLVKLKPNPSSLSIETASEIGEAKEEIPCKYEGGELEIGYNGNYLSSILSKIDAVDVHFLLKDPISAALITPAVQKEGEEIVYLLMPIRLE
ncbi:MAG: DNA polymerase III subunit beta [bacterium]|nr:DNA polymerase III subunit beta [bacterium]